MKLKGPHHVSQTDSIDDWLDSLDNTPVRKIAREISKMETGIFSNVKYLRDGIFELKINVGPGYRVYFTKREERLIILLHGGDKSSQDKDIIKAISLASSLK